MNNLKVRTRYNNALEHVKLLQNAWNEIHVNTAFIKTVIRTTRTLFVYLSRSSCGQYVNSRHIDG